MDGTNEVTCDASRYGGGMRLYRNRMIALGLGICIAAGVGCHRKTDDGARRDGMDVKTTTEILGQKTVSDEAVKDEAVKIGEVDPDDKKAVRDLFARFKQAVGRYDGKTASALLSHESLEHYQNLLDAISVRIETPELYEMFEKRLPIASRLTAEIMLKRLKPEFLLNATPQSLYEVAFNHGWIGYRSMLTASIDNMVRYEKGGKPYILADFYTEGTIRDTVWARIGFSREGDQWRIDLVPIFISVQKSVNDYTRSHVADVEGAIEKTVEESTKSLDPKNWKPFSVKGQFSVHFPRQPLLAKDGNWTIYTSQHSVYGQFDVRIRAYDSESMRDSMVLHSENQRVYIYEMLKTMGAEEIQCRDVGAPALPIVVCNFEVPSRESRGKSMWVFDSKALFLVWNIATKHAYSEDVAVGFVSSFSH